MKKNGWLLPLFIVLGLLAGALVSRWLKQVPGLSFLTDTMTIDWSPAADLYVVSYDLTIQLKISILIILGLVASIWLYRKY